MDKKRPIVISLGGSLIVPDEIDTDFLSYFRNIITTETEAGQRFAIVAGGGITARRYQDAARKMDEQFTDADLDWIGIYTTRMNARFLYHLLKDVASADIVTDQDSVALPDEAVLIGAGWKPGWSTDYVSVRIAEALGADRLINLSNIDAVYTSDPKSNPNAKKLSTLSWNEYRKLIPSDWTPGLNTPFDPIAAKRAEELGLAVVIMGGALANLERYFESGKFEGTTIS